jgi:hypothetical protein
VDRDNVEVERDPYTFGGVAGQRAHRSGGCDDRTLDEHD